MIMLKLLRDCYVSMYDWPNNCIYLLLCITHVALFGVSLWINEQERNMVAA